MHFVCDECLLRHLLRIHSCTWHTVALTLSLFSLPFAVITVSLIHRFSTPTIHSSIPLPNYNYQRVWHICNAMQCKAMQTFYSGKFTHCSVKKTVFSRTNKFYWVGNWIYISLRANLNSGYTILRNQIKVSIDAKFHWNYAIYCYSFYIFNI